MVTRNRRLATIAVLAMLTLAVGYDGYRLASDIRFNRARASGSNTENAAGDPYRQMAQAYDLQERMAFEQAVKAYAGIDARSGSPLQLLIKYNLANLYFRRALELRESGDDDLAMPLIELAKQNYKEILRADSTDWDAKYNLELALVLAPETDEVDPLGELNPERSPRALTIIKSRKSLP